jgi:hypothetical protein
MNICIPAQQLMALINGIISMSRERLARVRGESINEEDLYRPEISREMWRFYLSTLDYLHLSEFFAVITSCDENLVHIPCGELSYIYVEAAHDVYNMQAMQMCVETIILRRWTENFEGVLRLVPVTNALKCLAEDIYVHDPNPRTESIFNKIIAASSYPRTILPALDE